MRIIIPRLSPRAAATAARPAAHVPKLDLTELLGEVRFDDRGLVAAVAQDDATGDVLMVAWMDREALERTVESGDVHYHSRSRGKLWRKGETSGNTQRLVSLSVDCDGDALLLRVDQKGPACHTGERSCFFRTLGDGDGS